MTQVSYLELEGIELAHPQIGQLDSFLRVGQELVVFSDILVGVASGKIQLLVQLQKGLVRLGGLLFGSF